MKRLKLLVSLFFCFSVFLFFLSLKLQWLKVPTIIKVGAVYCRTQYGPCTQEEEKRLENLVGRDFLQLDAIAAAVKISENDFRIRRALVEKIFPGSLTVIIEKRKPITAVVKGENRVFLVDQEGVVVDLTETSTLPNLLVPENTELIVGERVLEDILAAAKILYLVNKSQGAQSASFEKQLVTVYLPGNISAIFAPVEGLEVRVGALQLILSRIKMDEKLPKTIDLRYSKPILNY